MSLPFGLINVSVQEKLDLEILSLIVKKILFSTNNLISLIIKIILLLINFSIYFSETFPLSINTLKCMLLETRAENDDSYQRSAFTHQKFQSHLLLQHCLSDLTSLYETCLFRSPPTAFKFSDI